MTEGLAAFLLTSLLVELTPGPNMAWLAIVAGSEGVRVGLAAVAGVALGLLLVGVAAALALAALVAASPVLYEALRWGGAAYLLWLAWGRGGGGAPAGAGAGAGLPAWAGDEPAQCQGGGVLLGGAAALHRPFGAGAGQSLGLTLAYVVVATGVHAGIALLAGQARQVLTDSRQERVVRRVLSVALAGVAVWLLWRT